MVSSIQLLVRKGVGSNPTLIKISFAFLVVLSGWDALPFPRLKTTSDSGVKPPGRSLLPFLSLFLFPRVWKRGHARLCFVFVLFAI